MRYGRHTVHYGARFHEEVLKVTLAGRSIAYVLALTVEDAAQAF